MPKTPTSRSVAGSEQLPEFPEYRKLTSYSSEQFNAKVSPGPPEKSWGGGSYDASGRQVIDRKPGYGKGGDGAKLAGGECTKAPEPPRPTRPGRW